MGQNHFLLREFCQMESITSGGLEDDDEGADYLDGNIYKRLWDSIVFCCVKRRKKPIRRLKKMPN